MAARSPPTGSRVTVEWLPVPATGPTGRRVPADRSPILADRYWSTGTGDRSTLTGRPVDRYWSTGDPVTGDR